MSRSAAAVTLLPLPKHTLVTADLRACVKQDGLAASGEPRDAPAARAERASAPDLEVDAEEAAALAALGLPTAFGAQPVRRSPLRHASKLLPSSSSLQAAAPGLVAVDKPHALSRLRGQVRQKRRQARQRASPGGSQLVAEAASQSEPADPPSAAGGALRAPESAALRSCEPAARRSGSGGDVGEAPAAYGLPGSGAADGALTCAEEAASSARSGEEGADVPAGEGGHGAGALEWPALARPEQWQQAYEYASGHLYYYREATQARPRQRQCARPAPRRPCGLAAQASPPRTCSPPPACLRMRALGGACSVIAFLHMRMHLRRGLSALP